MKYVTLLLALTVFVASASFALGENAPDAGAPDSGESTVKAARLVVKTTDSSDNPVVIPDPKRVTLLLFVMVGPQRNYDMLKHAWEATRERKDVTPIAVVSGVNAAIKAKQVAELAGWRGAIVLDDDYRLASSAHVRAWPTTVIVDREGNVASHIAGLTATYRRDLTPYLDRAIGLIDEATFARLISTDTGVPTRGGEAGQAADRHLALALKLEHQGRYADAAAELNVVLAAAPSDARAQVMMARIEYRLGRPRDALRRLDQVNPSDAPPWQLATVRGLALAGLGEWDKARAALIEAVKLNPQPAECYYQLGRAYEQASDWQRAAAAFRAAYETAHDAATRETN